MSTGGASISVLADGSGLDLLPQPLPPTMARYAFSFATAWLAHLIA